MTLTYLLTPLAAWLTAGSLKFIINSFKVRQWAFKGIGYGGLPSNHSTIVTSMACLIALNSGLNSPAFGVALTLALIVIIDAIGLRREMGKYAAALNQLNPHTPRLRERMGHTPWEVLAGILTGIAVGFSMYRLDGFNMI